MNNCKEVLNDGVRKLFILPNYWYFNFITDKVYTHLLPYIFYTCILKIIYYEVYLLFLIKSHCFKRLSA